MNITSYKNKRIVGKGNVSAPAKETSHRSDFSLEFSHKYKKTIGGGVESESRFSLNHSKEKDQSSEPFLIRLLRFIISVIQFFKKK